MGVVTDRWAYLEQIYICLLSFGESRCQRNQGLGLDGTLHCLPWGEVSLLHEFEESRMDIWSRRADTFSAHRLSSLFEHTGRLCLPDHPAVDGPCDLELWPMEHE